MVKLIIISYGFRKKIIPMQNILQSISVELVAI